MATTLTNKEYERLICSVVQEFCTEMNEKHYKVNGESWRCNEGTDHLFV
jgi:hypothetical protein